MKKLLMAAIAATMLTSAFGGHEDHETDAKPSGRMDSIQDAAAALANARTRLEQHLEEKETVKAAGAARDAARAAEEAIRYSDEINVKSKKPLRDRAAAIKESAVKVLRAAEQNKPEDMKQQATTLIKEADALLELVSGKKVAAKAGKKSPGAEKKETAAAELKELGNPECPISGHPVGSMQAGSHIKYDGYKVGLCCDSCQGAFLKEPKKFLKAAMEQKK